MSFKAGKGFKVPQRRKKTRTTLAAPKRSLREKGASSPRPHRSSPFSKVPWRSNLSEPQTTQTPRRRLEEKYQGYLSWDMWHEEIQEGHAMLVGLSDENSPALLQPTQPEDAEFVRKWWSQSMPLLCSLDRFHPMLANTALAPPVEWPEPPVILDTPPTGPGEEEQCRSEDGHYTRPSSNPSKRAKTRQMHESVTLGSCKMKWDGQRGHRHRLTLTLSAPSTCGTSSSTSMSIPLPAEGRPIALHLQVIRVDKNESEPAPENEEAKLMQMNPPNHHSAVLLLNALPTDVQAMTLFDIFRRRTRQRCAALHEVIQPQAHLLLLPYPWTRLPHSSLTLSSLCGAQTQT